MRHPNVRLLVVDDQSPDGTGEWRTRWRASIPGRVEVMHRTGRRGLGRSYLDGIQQAVDRARSMSSARWTATSRTTRVSCRR